VCVWVYVIVCIYRILYLWHIYIFFFGIRLLNRSDAAHFLRVSNTILTCSNLNLTKLLSSWLLRYKVATSKVATLQTCYVTNLLRFKFATLQTCYGVKLATGQSCYVQSCYLTKPLQTCYGQTCYWGKALRTCYGRTCYWGINVTKLLCYEIQLNSSFLNKSYIKLLYHLYDQFRIVQI
jgi:hypothetical protein